jgi:signal transduction histidine kinase
MSDVETRLRRQERILELSRELISTVSLEPLLHKIVAAAAELTGSEIAALLLLDKRTGGLRFVATSNVVDQLLNIPVPIAGSIAGAALTSGEPLIILDAPNDPRHYKGVDELVGIETRSLLAVPLQFKEQQIGVLEAENKQGGETFCREDVETLTALAAQATVAIENARLVRALQQSRDELEHQVGERTAELSAANVALKGEITERAEAETELRRHQDHLEDLVAERVAELRKANEQLEREISERGRAESEREQLLKAEREQRKLAEALRQASAALSSTLDYDEVLDRILEQVRQVVPEAAASIMLIEGVGPLEDDGEPGQVAGKDTVRILRGHGYEQFGTEAGLMSITLDVDDVAGLQKMQQTGQPLVIPYVEDYEDWVYSRPEHTWIKSYIGVPIRVWGLVAGFLNVNSATPGFFGQADAERLRVFADHAAIAIENARLYHQAQQELAERMRAERELHRHRDHLEELVGERTAELIDANEQLQWEITERKQAEETLRRYTVELETRNEELDAFAHTVAHDLKNPLALIVGYAEALDGALLEGEQMSYHLRMIARNGHKMSSIIDELLLLASMRKLGGVELGPLDMAGVVDEACLRLVYMIEEHKAEIVLPDEWPVPWGYGPWVEEVWANYMSNALKYGGQPPRVELGADLLPSVPSDDGEEEKGRMGRFWIRDNGRGLTPEEQARLFTPFTRLDQVSAKGHGLGLSIVRRIVEKMGGQVGVESRVGEGSTFSFTLPLAPAVNGQ